MTAIPCTSRASQMVAVRTSVTSLDLSSWPSRHSNLSGLSLRLANSVVTHEQSALVLRLALIVCCVLQVLPSWHVDQARLFPHLHENQCARLPSRHACSRHQGQERGALHEGCYVRSGGNGTIELNGTIESSNKYECGSCDTRGSYTSTRSPPPASLPGSAIVESVHYAG